jgi:hypothetical protein
MALVPDQGPRIDQARYQPEAGHLHRPEPQGTIQARQNLGDPVGYDQQMAEESRSGVSQRPVGEDTLSGYGPVTHGNRLVRTRLLGGVGRAGERPALTRFEVDILIYHIRTQIP